MTTSLINGDCLAEMAKLADNSVDLILTDPPYELGFMGKSWDSTGIANNIDMWAQALRVLKPGGYLLAFSGTRTYHRMTSAIEDAGFEVRDMIAWCYGQGFPKSLNISLQIKKKYNIGLCTCNVFEPMLKLECNNLKHSYENSNNKRDNISNGDNDGLGFGEQIQGKGTNDNEVEEQAKDTNLSPDCTIRKESGVCELSEKDNKKEQGFEKVSESILQSGVCESISENEGLGNTTLRSGLEENKTTGEREGQSMSDMQNKTTDGIAGSSLNTVQNGGQELYGELGVSLSQLPQQDRENNRKRVEQIKNDCNTEEWNNLSRFICSKCYCLKKDIGGTALKPSIEPICMARKPLAEKTVAENCLKWGTGGINIDESRVEHNEELKVGFMKTNREKGLNSTSYGGEKDNRTEDWTSTQGRFPANLIHDNSEEVRECFPDTKASKKRIVKDDEQLNKKNTVFETSGYKERFGGGINDNGGNASRFFKSIIYQAKASKSDRNAGCDGLEETCAPKQGAEKRMTVGGSKDTALPRANHHPTVKPTALMEYLATMCSRENATILDPFMGSGTTGVACVNTNRNFIGIELDKGYFGIASSRINSAISDKAGLLL